MLLQQTLAGWQMCKHIKEGCKETAHWRYEVIKIFTEDSTRGKFVFFFDRKLHSVFLFISTLFIYYRNRI